MQQVRAKKQLGQHFLKDLSIAQQIADTLHVATPICGNPLRVLEIGPGMGVLTQFLLQQPDYEVTAIEIDHESVDYLLAMKAGAKREEGRGKSEEVRGKSEEGEAEAYWQRLNLIEGDFLRLPIDELYPEGPFCVIGNYPYNISSQIFFKVLEHKDRIPVCAGMIQKEVAERLAAKPGCKAYGILSVLLQAYYDIEYLFTVHEHVFNPPPKVKSAVVRFTRNSRSHLGCDEALFKQVVKTAFNQRRKQMRNSLKGLVESKGESQKTQDLLKDPIFTKRPEQLSVNEFIELTKKISLCLN